VNRRQDDDVAENGLIALDTYLVCLVGAVDRRTARVAHRIPDLPPAGSYATVTVPRLRTGLGHWSRISAGTARGRLARARAARHSRGIPRPCVLDPPGRAGVLPLHARRAGAFSWGPGLIDYHRRGWIIEVLDDVADGLRGAPAWWPLGGVSVWCAKKALARARRPLDTPAPHRGALQRIWRAPAARGRRSYNSVLGIVVSVGLRSAL
jgi:hypothetical protein